MNISADREIRSAFLLAMTLTVCGASSVLAFAEGTFFPVGLTPFIAIAARQFNERRRWLVLPTIGANILGVLAVLAAGAELVFGSIEARILSGAHLIVYITWIVLFMNKQQRQYWWLLALSVLQLAVSSVLTRSSNLGLALIIMLFLIVWTLALFTLHRLRIRTSRSETTEPGMGKPATQPLTLIHHGIQTDSGMKWIGTRFRLMVLGMCFASLLISGLAFAAFPRVFVGTPSILGDMSSDGSGLIQRTGFREQVRLGEFGSILESNERVLTIDITDLEDGSPMSVEDFADRMGNDELLLRGSVMGRYTSAQWHSGLQENQTLRETKRHQFSAATAPRKCVRVSIVQDPPIGTFAFAPTPIVEGRLTNARGRLMQRTLSESTEFGVVNPNRWHAESSPNFNAEPISFEVYCPLPEDYHRRWPPIELPGMLLQWLYPNGYQNGWMRVEEDYAREYTITPNLESTVPHLCQIAHDLCRDGARPPECVRRVVRLLRDSGDYSYSLQVAPVDTSLDPVDDFLINHRSGHCQYFASACALMLQSVGIPARIVNGFKGSEINVITGETEVRQKHAHVWVEYRYNRRWHTVDPTPGSRDDFLRIAENQGVLGNIQTAVSDLWDAGMNNVTPERQRAAIEPFMESVRNGATKVRQLGLIGATKAFLAQAFGSPSDWISWKALVATVLVLLPPALLLRNRPWRWFKSLLSWLRGRWSPQHRAATQIVRFYETFCTICARAGLVFPDSHTACENAALARSHFLDERTADIQAIPGRIADAFNAVRYGNRLLTPEQTDDLGRDIIELRQAIFSTDHSNHNGVVSKHD